MYAPKLNLLYLHDSQGNLDSMEYHFYSYSINKDIQSNASFFITPIEDNSWLNHDGMMETPKSYIGGLIYCNWQGLSSKIQSDFLHHFKSSIYYSIGNYEKAFQSALDYLQEYLFSLDLVCDTSQQVWRGYDALLRTQISANLFLKMGDQLFISKSIYPNELIKNCWLIKEKGSDQYRNLDLQNEVIDVANEYFQVDEHLVNRMDELIFSDTTNQQNRIIENIQKQDPFIFYDEFYFYNIHFLRLIS